MPDTVEVNAVDLGVPQQPVHAAQLATCGGPRRVRAPGCRVCRKMLLEKGRAEGHFGWQWRRHDLVSELAQDRDFSGMRRELLGCPVELDTHMIFVHPLHKAVELGSVRGSQRLVPLVDDHHIAAKLDEPRIGGGLPIAVPRVEMPSAN
eukprot:1023387-Prymnesium_polylepis.2